MLLRGRLTIAALALAAVALLDRSLAGSGETPSASGETVRPAPPAAPGPPAPALAPPELFARLPVTRERFETLEAASPASAVGRRSPIELRDPPPSRPDLRGPLRIEYTLDAALAHEVFRLLERGRVALGHVLVMDPETGRLLAYVSTDLERFPPDRVYPAASLVKVITAAALLHQEPQAVEGTCRTVGSPYRLTPRRVDPSPGGRPVTLRRALATSDNQCFAQIAVHRVGSRNLLGAIDRFGWLRPPAPLHAPGQVEVGEDSFELGKLGAGLAGARITPLHAVQLAGTLATGRRMEPTWIDRVTDGEGRPLLVPRQPSERVMTPELAARLREMLVDTTVRGTARRAFRTRRGPVLGPVQVAGKTGSLSGSDPDGRYEWFVGVAPAAAPRVAVAVLVVQGKLWWMTPAQVAAETLKVVFCPKGVCRPEAAQAWLEPSGEAAPSESAARES
jgi:membrane peptidoglycan carboxypeptidase